MARKLYDEHGNEVIIKKRRGGCLKYLVIGLLIIVAVGYFASEQEEGLTTSTSEPVATVKKQEEPVEEKKDEPDVPREYHNALKKAESYAKTMHMSKLAVYEQLVSEYGENFPEEAAQYAIDNLTGINWNENALKKAESYFENMHMSKDEVYNQLISDYGEQFTPEQAQYAVDHLD